MEPGTEKPFEGKITLAQFFPRTLTDDEVKRVSAAGLAGCYSCVKCLARVSPSDIEAGKAARRRYTLDGVTFHNNGVLCEACDKIVPRDTP